MKGFAVGAELSTHGVARLDFPGASPYGALEPQLPFKFPLGEASGKSQASVKNQLGVVQQHEGSA